MTRLPALPLPPRRSGTRVAFLLIAMLVAFRAGAASIDDAVKDGKV